MTMLLHGIGPIDAFHGFTIFLWSALNIEYTADELTEIISALRFAADNPGYDFASLMPDIQYSNADTHKFLCKVLASIVESGRSPA